MPLKPNAELVFDSYTVNAGGIELNYVCYDPGPGESTDYRITVSDAEVSPITTVAQFDTLVAAKLKRLYRAQGISSKLDRMIGRTVTLP